MARGSVSRVIDGRDFVLDDGREVHLAAVEVPLLPVAGDTHAAPGGAAAKAALAALMSGAQVVLRAAEFSQTATDGLWRMRRRCAGIRGAPQRRT